MLWFRSYTFTYRAKLGPALQALTRSVEQHPRNGLYLERVERRVKIGKKMSMFRLVAYAVCFIGHFEEDGDDTVLKGYFRPPLVLMWCMGAIAVAQLFVVLHEYSFLSQTGVFADFYDRFLRPARPVDRVEALLALLALVPLNLLGWMFELPAELQILEALQHSSE